MAPFRRCVVRNCSLGLYTPPSLHRIPTTEEERRIWMKFLKGHEFNSFRKFKIGKTSSICSRHFQNGCLLKNGRYETIKTGHYPTVGVDKDGISRKLNECLKCDQVVPDGSRYSTSDYMVSTTPSESDILTVKLSDSNLLIDGYSKQLVEKNAEIAKLRRQIRKLKSLVHNLSTSLGNEAKSMPAKATSNQFTQTRCNEFEKIETEPNGREKFASVVNTLKHRLHLRQSETYSHDFKEFSVALHYHSPKAYVFLRDIFCSTLPHPRTLNRWVSGIKTSPGFLPDALTFISSRIESERRYYALSIDEMAIRKQISFDGTEMTGFVDFGNFPVSAPTNLEAKNALFVMATEINGSCKVPIAYLLTNGGGNQFIGTIINESIIRLHAFGGIVLTVTFDGLPSNFLAIDFLGGDSHILDPKYQHWIPHPSDADAKVYFTPDPCHMIKLLRNALEAYNFFIDGDGNDIKWIYFVRLVELQKKEELKAGTKITSRHTEFTKQKMKVKLAVQLLSSSTADALNFCEKLGLPEFQGSTATAKFARTVDKIFDLLNSRVTGTACKAPLSASNQAIWRTEFQSCKEYLLNLKIRRTNKKKLVIVKALAKSRRSTCIRGFIICIDSLVSIMDTVVLPNSTALSYFPTYKISQDQVELFFSSLRQRFGSNNNPNTIQLEAALKRMLAVRIKPNLAGNCTPIEDSTTAKISTLNSSSCASECEEVAEYDEYFDNREDDESEEDDSNLLNDEGVDISEDEDFVLPFHEDLSPFVINVVSFISGHVGRSLSKSLTCELCSRALLHSDPDFARIRSDYILLNQKDNGGLFIPSEDLVSVCKEAELVIRESQNYGLNGVRLRTIIRVSMERLLVTNIFQNLRFSLSEDHNASGTHTCELVKLIISKYSKIRLHYIAKQKTLTLSPIPLRNQMTKQVLFDGQ